jgi:trigger factor
VERSKVKVEVKEIAELVRELSVEIPADTVNDEMEKTFTDLRRKATIKGFRKGKAPMAIIKFRFGEEVKVDVADQLIRSSYPKAIEDKQLKVASPPTLTAHNFDGEGTFRYTAKVEVFPGIERVGFDDLQITTVDIEIGDEEVEEQTEFLRLMFADYRPVDREVRDNDVVTADLKKVYDPDLVLKTDLMSDVEIDLTRRFTIKEFKEQLPGMKLGEEKEIKVAYDNDYLDRTLAGAHITYTCKVKGIKECLLPEFDDVFAKRTGKAETALELRIKLREDLKRQGAKELRRFQRGQIIRQVCEQNLIPIPQSMVNDYLDAIVEEEKEKKPSIGEDEIRNNARDMAVNTLRWNMLYHHLAGQEKIEVSPSDTEQLIKGFADDYKITSEQAKQALERSGKISNIRDTILEEKVLDFLIGKAKVTVKKKEEVKE